jgi:hypothetical protein
MSTGFWRNFNFLESPWEGQRQMFFGANSGSMDISTRRENEYVNRKKRNIYRAAVHHIDTVGIIGMSG